MTDPTPNSETHYEMLWDCEVCQAHGLLGVSHRHCPNCGTTQNPARRYFPPTGQEVEAKNHVYWGADWRCAYCQSPNSLAAKFCVNCGAGQDGSQPVALIADIAAIPDTAEVKTDPAQSVPLAALSRAPAVKSGRSSPWLGAVVLGILALLIGGIWQLASMFFTTTTTEVTVVARMWERSIAIERFGPNDESAWCDSVPAGAYQLTRSREVRSHRQVASGQDCHKVRIDKGDGSFVKKSECMPRYIDEPVHDEFCRYRINRWQVARSVRANQSSSPLSASPLSPVWPLVGQLQGGGSARLGSEREGARSERYEVTLTAADKTWHCAVDEARWQGLRDGSRATLAVRMIGGADCASLK